MSQPEEHQTTSNDRVAESTAQAAPRDSKAASSAVPDALSSTWKQRMAAWSWLGRSLINSALVLLVFLGVLWSFGFALRQGWFPELSQSTESGNGTGLSQRYICPMMCVPATSAPGRCPVCGMELVAATATGDSDGVSITIQPAHRRLIGIQTAQAKLESVNRTIRTIGSIEYDESKLSTISAYVDGRLEQLYADYIGVPVNQDDDLALIYSPELYTAQAEYLSAQDQQGSSRFVDNTRLRELAAEKLFELGMSEAQIAKLTTERIPQPRIRIRSPQRGRVIEKLAIEGDYVKTGQSIYRIADLSTVWLMLDLFPDDAARILFGQEVEAEISSAPGVIFTGRVAFVDPTVNAETRTVRVRVEMLNFDGKLRPGDYATARVTVPAIPRDQVYDPALAGKYISPMHPQVIRDNPGTCPICDMNLIPTADLGFASQPLPEQEQITIPRDAVLMAGDDSVVYVETEPGRFEVRRIHLGALTDRQAIIAAGLNPGEVVATQGNFLLDSQSQLAGNPSLLDPTKAPEFSPGPLQLELPSDPLVLPEDAASAFDQAYLAYFEIQKALAADQPASPVAINSLIDGLVAALNSDAVPDAAQQELLVARNASSRLSGSLETSRVAFRTVSHAMIKAVYQVRGSETQNRVAHFFCPMVPGGGGDWLQNDNELRNPYWGAEMLTCGELVEDLSFDPLPPPSDPSDSEGEDPFAGMEMQSLELED